MRIKKKNNSKRYTKIDISVSVKIPFTSLVTLLAIEARRSILIARFEGSVFASIHQGTQHTPPIETSTLTRANDTRANRDKKRDKRKHERWTRGFEA